MLLIRGRGIELWIYAIRRPYLATFAMLQDVFDLAIAVEFESPVLHNGVACGSGWCVEQAAQRETEHRLYPGLVLEVITARDHADQRGWSQGQGLLRRLPPLTLARLKSAVARVYPPAIGQEADSVAGRDGSFQERGLLDFVESMLDAGDPTPLAPVEESRTGDRRTVAMTVELIAECDPESALSVAGLARGVGVSERTLYRIFSRCLGVSPHRYLLSWRLQNMRHRLLAGTDGPSPVTRAATGAGFDHLGEMGRQYRRAFGETPSQTLRHRRRASVSLTVTIGD